VLRDTIGGLNNADVTLLFGELTQIGILANSCITSQKMDGTIMCIIV